MGHMERDKCPTCNYWIGALVEATSTEADPETAVALAQSLKHHVYDYFLERAEATYHELRTVLESRLATNLDAFTARKAGL